MPRKPEPSFELKKIIWGVAATVGKDKPTDIQRQLDYELEKRRKEEGDFFEGTPDVRTISRIVKEINELDPEVVVSKLPSLMWKLRDDYESVKQLAQGSGQTSEQAKIDLEQQLKPQTKALMPGTKPHDKRILQDSSPKLPLELVNKDQEKHWQDVESHLVALEQPFSDIDLNDGPFYRDFSCDENITEEMHSHFRDTAFWQNVNNYNEKANKANSIQKDLVEEIMHEALKVAPLEDIWLEQEQCITPYYVFSVIDISLGKVVRFIQRYNWDELIQTLACQGSFISKGINSEKKHRELVEIYSKDERVKSLSDTITELRNLRGEILTRLQSAINDNEYKYSFCSKCPLIKSGYVKL